MRTVGFVVAGGRSTRMGRDKALLPWGATTLLGHAAARLREVCDEVRLLSGSRERYAEQGLPVDVDVVAEAGALGGLLTGLQRLAPEAPGLFLAVDLPLVPVELLSHLLERSADADAVVPLSPGGPEPLCAVYRGSCRAAVERRILAGDLKMTSFWPEVSVRRLEVRELAAFGDPSRVFRNLNAPEDYAALAEAAQP